MTAPTLTMRLDLDVTRVLANAAAARSALNRFGSEGAAGRAFSPAVPGGSAVVRVGGAPVPVGGGSVNPLVPRGNPVNPINPRVNPEPVEDLDRKVKKTGDSVSKLNGQFDTLGSAVTRFGTIAAAALSAAVIGGAALAGTAIVKLGVQAEQTRMSFQTMMGDAGKGNAMLGMLNEFANVTPFTNAEVVGAGKTLMAFGVEAGNVKTILKSVGDAAAGSGKPFGELAMIIGKVYAKGKADSETLNQMSEAGIPIIKQLSQQYGKSAAEIYKMAENGQLSRDVILAAFQQMTSEGGIFADMMNKQAGTVGGMWSTATGQLSYFGSLIGESVTPLLKDGLQILMGWTDELVKMGQDGRAVEYVASLGMTGALAGGEMIKWFNRVYEYGAATFKTLQRVSSVQFEGLQAVIVGGFVMIVDTGIKAINALIAAANKIPGIDIKLAQRPEFVDALDTWAKSAAQTASDDLSAIASGKDFTAAGENIDRKNSAVDAGMRKITDYITGWQDKAQNELINRKVDEQKFASELNQPQQLNPELNGKTKADKAAKLNVDELTKVGGYNFGGPGQIKSIDVDRNNLLKQMVDLLAGMQEDAYELA